MDPELWNPLLKRRKACQSKIKKISKKIADHSTTPLDEIYIEDLQDQLKTASSDFKSLQQEIFELCPDDDQDKEINTQIGVSELFEDEASDCKRKLKYIMKQVQAPSVTNPSSSLNQTAKISDVKLPVMELPTFDGKYEDWISFKDLFHSTVHNQKSLSDAQRLQYLKSAVKGEAYSLIKSFSITSANYAPACNVLQDRYENKREIIYSILKRFLSQQPLVKESAAGLQSLLDTTNECIRALAVLNRPVATWDDIIIYMVVDKMDSDSKRQWALSLRGTEPPTFAALSEFITQHVRGLLAAKSSSKQQHHHKANSSGSRDGRITSSHHGSTENKCFICKSSHYILECTKFKSLTPQERSKSAREKNLCLNCLKPGHYTKECKNQRKCKSCGKNHHTLLHFEKQQQAPSSTSSSSSQANSSSVSTHFSNNYSNHVLLSTALVKARDLNGTSHVLRVLLDNGSEASFITESCVQALGLSRKKANVTVSGISSSNIGQARGYVCLNLFSCINNSNFEVEALILNKVTGTLPKFQCKYQNLSYINHLQLADPKYYQPGEIDLLLGADIADSLMLDGIIRGPNSDNPIARNSTLGWIVSGKVHSTNIQNYHVYHCEVDGILRKFWELEELPPQKHLNNEEKLCEQHFIKTQHRDSNGRFVLPLPFNEKITMLGESRDRAVRRWKQVEKKLSSNQQHQLEYANFMKEYLSLNHMERIPSSEIHQQPSFYLPHHFVLKEESSTTKFRVVFDGSAKSTTGISLNNCLMAGANVQDDLFSLLLRFRIHIVALKADIGKMYRQFNIPKQESNYQRIVWRESIEKPIQDFRLLTLTYGTTSAAFLATRSLNQLAEDGREEFPLASRILSQDFYVDDLMSGASSEAEAISIQQQLCSLLRTAGMDLRKWSSSHPSVLNQIPMEMREVQETLEVKADSSVKALGICWNANDDKFSFSVIIPSRKCKLTKRVVLSELAKVFDPLGWLSPVTINAKLLFQELWKENLEWDDELPSSIQQQWDFYQDNISQIKFIKIPRCIVASKFKSQQLHAFCDASEKAYGAVLYLRTEREDGSIMVHLITSKTRVAPIKQVSLPRLELCGAVLLANLVSTFKLSTNLNCQIFAWTDSTIVIKWLSSFPGRWKTFVANRVAEVQDLIPVEDWRHVSSEDNPADCISRGISPTELPYHQLWWNGPSWLKQMEYPLLQQHQYDEALIAAEEKQKLQLCHHLCIEDSLLCKYSNLSKLKRVTAYVLRFIYNFKNQKTKMNMKTGFLSCKELQEALYFWIIHVQGKEFSSDIKALKSSKELPTSSKIKQLMPFIDQVGLLRVGRRLQHSNIHEDSKHQIILPSNNILTTLIINHYHLTNLHSGFQLLWASLQQKFWILRARDVIRFQIRKCVVCRRVRAELASQLMGSLPSARVNPGKPFNQTGLDFAGPFNIKPFKGRGNRTFKCHFVIFVCFSTKAVHLESVGEMTTEAFIGSLKRFVARRGLCSHLYSDCGTNLVGADKELHQLFLSSQHQANIAKHLSDKGISWHFNSPAAPHHGGLWEAGVKSVKHHLKRVMGNALLTLEEFNTVLCQVEGCLNSRPICAMSTDPADYSVLTPGHFLTGEALNAIPEPDLTTINMNRLSRWQHTQQLLQHFWRRWKSEYLTSLQQRFKWIHKRDNLQVGDLVTIRDERLPPLKWNLGRIIEVHPGSDSLVRVATVKTSSGEFKRPIAKLCAILYKDE